MSSPPRLTALLLAAALSPLAFTQPMFVEISDKAGVAFTHATTQTVLSQEEMMHSFMDEVAFLGSEAEFLSSWITGGVAAGDFDGDGWLDLFAVGGNAGVARLYRNRGDGTFVDVAAAAGVAVAGERQAGAVFADYDGDHDLDLWVGGALATPPRLFRNDGPTAAGQTTFTDIFTAAFPGFASERIPNSWGGAFGDYDGDHDLDLFIPHSNTPPGPVLAPQIDGSTQHLWRNDGQGSFTDVSDAAGISILFGAQGAAGLSLRDHTFSPTFTDFDGDGDADLVISGDIGSSRVLGNLGDGTFVNLTDAQVIDGRTAMGTAVADYDNDGHFDWFVSHVREFLPATGNRLYRGKAGGAFEQVTDIAGVRDGHWGWGACFADFDNDRHLDIFHVNGFYFPDNPFSQDGRFTDDPAVLFVANGDGTFSEQAAASGVADIGEGRGVACFDFDRDGDIDIAISNHRGPFRLYENRFSKPKAFLVVRLRGRSPNTEGIGARITVRSLAVGEASPILTREVRAGSNFLSANPAEAHFGLGDWRGPLRVDVRWPSGATSTLEKVMPGQFLVIEEPPRQR